MIHSVCHSAGISTKINLPNLEISKTSVTIEIHMMLLRLLRSDKKTIFTFHINYD